MCLKFNLNILEIQRAKRGMTTVYYQKIRAELLLLFNKAIKQALI